MRQPLRQALLLLTLLALGINSALAHGRTRVGVYVGPSFGIWGYPSPWFYPPPVVVLPAPSPQPPTVYIERAPVNVQAAPEPSWYYCASAEAYYPYVKSCPEPWQPVLPHPEK